MRKRQKKEENKGKTEDWMIVGNGGEKCEKGIEECGVDSDR